MNSLRVGGWFLRRVTPFAVAIVLLVASAAAQTGGFGGMGGFGASGGAAAQVSGESPAPALRPWVSVGGSYFKDMTLLDPTETNNNTGSYFGGSFTGAVVGSKQFQRSSLQGSYMAGGSYGGDSGVNGLSHTGSLQFAHQFSERAWMSVRQMGGSSFGGYGYGAGFGGVNGFFPFNNGWTGSLTGFNSTGGLTTQDPADNGIVDAEPFDNRATFYSANATFGYMLTRRVSVSGSGGGGIVRRSGESLLDLNTAGTSGQITFQATERFGIGGFYGYSRYTYADQYGSNEMQSAATFLSYLATPRTSIFVSLGGQRLFSDQFGSVPVPPELAEILGVTSVVEVQQFTRYSPNISAGVRYRPQIGNFSLIYNKGLIPGNGVLRSANRDMFTASYGRGRGRFSYGASAYFQKASGVTEFHGVSDIYQGSGAFSFRIAGGLHVMTSAGYRTIDVGASPNRNQTFATVSLAWSPGSYPIGF